MLTDILTRLAPLGFWWLGAPVLILDLVAIGRALVRGHGVESTLAWIFAVLAFPGVGACAYLLLANPGVRREVRRKRKAQLPRTKASIAGDDRWSVAGELLRLASNLSGLPATDGNRVEVMVRDARSFESIERTIASAKKSIWAEYYIVNNDETGRRFLDLLTRAAKRGIDVRLLYDAVGSLGLDSARLKSLRNAGGRVVSFLPTNPLKKRWALHLRNHRKLIVVDGEIAFTGGMNVGDEYSGRSRRRGRRHFKDANVSITGPAVADLAMVFAEDWTFSTDETADVSDVVKASGGSARLSIVPSGPDQEYNASALIYFTGVTLARKSCFITTPYFVPDEPTVRALVSAAKRGVDVRLLVPAHCDVPLVGPAARSSFPILVRAGVRVFEYLPSMLHAKTISIDSQVAVVGSANVDMRSFRFNFELGVVIVDESVSRALEEKFMMELKKSREITVADLDKIPLPTQIGRGFARLLSPLL